MSRRVDLSDKAWRVWAVKSSAKQRALNERWEREERLARQAVEQDEQRERDLRVLMASYDPTPFNPPRLTITWRKPSEDDK